MAKIINSKSLYKISGSITLDKNDTAYIYIYIFNILVVTKRKFRVL